MLIKPCPKQGTRFGPEAVARGDKAQFPLLVDPNTNTVLYESADIVDYLVTPYTERRDSSSRGLSRTLRLAGGLAASALNWRPGGISGIHATAAHHPEAPLELFSFETSPYSKPVRARLCELELPYILRNAGKGAWSDMGPPLFRDRLFKRPRDTTRNRARLHSETGRVQVPYLIDVNTDTALYESAEILRNLDRTDRRTVTP